MKALFLITESEFEGSKFETTVELMDYSGEFRGLKDARTALMNQINILANSVDSNEMQPTMNFKDRFHFYITQENGVKEKRHIVISDTYKASRMSLRMIWEAKDKIKDYSNPV